MTSCRTAIRTVALALFVVLTAAPVAAQQPPAPAPPTDAEIAAAEAELAAIEEALREAEAEAREAEAEARVAEAEARAEAAEAAAEAAAEEAAQIVREAEQLIAEPVTAPAIPAFQPEPPRRRSAWRTTTGIVMLGAGALLTGTAWSKSQKDDASAQRLRARNQLNLAARYEEEAEKARLYGIYPGVTLAFWGALLATVYADVADDDTVAVNVSPAGGVRVSKSFGW